MPILCGFTGSFHIKGKVGAKSCEILIIAIGLREKEGQKMFNRMLITTFLLLVIATSAWYSTVAEAQQFVTNGLVSFWSFA